MGVLGGPLGTPWGSPGGPYVLKTYIFVRYFDDVQGGLGGALGSLGGPMAGFTILLYVLANIDRFSKTMLWQPWQAIYFSSKADLNVWPIINKINIKKAMALKCSFLQ